MQPSKYVTVIMRSPVIPMNHHHINMHCIASIRLESLSQILESKSFKAVIGQGEAIAMATLLFLKTSQHPWSWAWPC